MTEQKKPNLAAADYDEIFKKDFDALRERETFLKNIYGDGWHALEAVKTETIWRTIGRPSDHELFTLDRVGYLLKQLTMIDPILTKFFFYVTAPAEALNVRAQIAQEITPEDENIHLCYYTWIWFNLFNARTGPLMLYNLVNKIVEDYNYYKYVDVYWLACKQHGKECPDIGELRKKLRRERTYSESNIRITERKRAMPYGTCTHRILRADNYERQEFEVDIYEIHKKIYDAIDEEFIDMDLCGGIGLEFPEVSDKLFASDKYWFGGCDRLILRCGEEKKEFKLALLDKYWGSVKKISYKYSFERCDKPDDKETEKAHSRPVDTPEIQTAILGLAQAAKSYRKKQAASISGHLSGGIREQLRKQWKAKPTSTIEDYETRLEQLKYGLAKDGYTADSPEWKRRVEKFESTKGRISKSELINRSAVELDKKVYEEDGGTIGDTIPSSSMSPEYLLMATQEEQKSSVLISELMKRFPSLIKKLSDKDTGPLSSAERKQLERIRKDPRLQRAYKRLVQGGSSE